MRLAAPSYLVPGTWLENLRAASTVDWIEGVELLFFSYDEDARRCLDAELSGIESFVDRFDYSLHLPDPLTTADERLVELTRPFVPRYVVHPPRIGVASETLDSWAELIDTWRSRHGDVFLLEYTERESFAAAEREYSGLPLCADSGRLLLDGEDPVAWMKARAERIGEVHLHAARAGKDHLALSARDGWLPEAARFLAATDWRVEIEVFSMEGACSSARALEAARGRI
jgi:sugar phosphate isomerase/epimerase